MIRAEILASYANISKRKGASSPGHEVFFNIRSNRTSFCFSFPGIKTEARTGIFADVVGCCVSSVVFSIVLGMISQIEYLSVEVQHPVLQKHASYLQNH